MSDGTVFIVLCFVTRCINAVGFSAAVTASFAVSAKVFPDNIATVLVSCARSLFSVQFIMSEKKNQAMEVLLFYCDKDVLFLQRASSH